MICMKMTRISTYQKTERIFGYGDEKLVKNGNEKLKIPAGTQPGKVFTLKARGVPYIRKSGRGDELVIVNVDIPSKLTKEQKDLFEKLAATLGTTVSPKEKGFLDWLNEALGG